VHEGDIAGARGGGDVHLAAVPSSRRRHTASCCAAARDDHAINRDVGTADDYGVEHTATETAEAALAAGARAAITTGHVDHRLRDSGPRLRPDGDVRAGGNGALAAVAAVAAGHAAERIRGIRAIATTDRNRADIDCAGRVKAEE